MTFSERATYDRITKLWASALPESRPVRHVVPVAEVPDCRAVWGAAALVDAEGEACVMRRPRAGGNAWRWLVAVAGVGMGVAWVVTWWA